MSRNGSSYISHGARLIECLELDRLRLTECLELARLMSRARLIECLESDRRRSRARLTERQKKLDRQSF